MFQHDVMLHICLVGNVLCHALHADCTSAQQVQPKHTHCLLQRPLIGLRVVMPDSKDKKLKSLIVSMGAVILAAMSDWKGGKALLVVNDVTASTRDIQRARQLGIRTQNVNDFKYEVQRQYQNFKWWPD